MNTFGKIAITAAELCQSSPGTHPSEAWASAARRHSDSDHMRKKCCPKCAFLALCEIGAVKGIPPGSYTTSVKNKEYTLAAYTLLQNEPEIERHRGKWWERATGGGGVSHNNQLGIILALKDAGLLASSPDFS